MQRILLNYLLIAVLLSLSCSPGGREPVSSDRKNTLYISLGLYTPGTKLAFGDPLKASREVAEEYTRQHPEIEITFIHHIQMSGGQEGEWLKTQLVGGIAPDVISQNAEVAWPDVPKGWYVPLDEFLERPNPYIEGNTRWVDSFVNLPLVNAKRAPDGKLYCISVDVVETAIYYNKTLFENLGLSLPETWSEFIKLLSVLRDYGIIPLASGANLGSDWGQDIIFDMLYYDIVEQLDVEPSLETQKAYMTHYLTPKEVAFLYGKGFFTRKDPRWVEMHRILKEWRAYWPQELKNTDTARLFLTQRAAMVWDGCWFTRRLVLDPYLDFEWGIFYLPKITQETSLFGSGVDASVIGGSAVQLHVTNSAEIYDHLEQVIDFLMYYTAPQNFSRVLNEALMFLPNIQGIEIPAELAPINDIFQRRYCTIKWLESFDAKYKSYWRRMLDLFLDDGMSTDEFLASLEVNFQQFVDEKMREQNWDFSTYEQRWQENKVEAQ